MLQKVQLCSSTKMKNLLCIPFQELQWCFLHSSLSYSITHSGHFSYSSSVITNETICINGQPSSNSAQHPKGSYCNTVHSSKAETNKNAKRDGKNRNDGRFISQSKAKDNIGCCSSAAGICYVLYRTKKLLKRLNQ